MKVIDLLNKISKDGNIPNEIKYGDDVYLWNDETKYYESELYTDIGLCWDFVVINGLNDEIEIIEDKEMCHKCHKYPAEYNQTWCEFCLGISKEEKKMPEKLKWNEKSQHNVVTDNTKKTLEHLLSRSEQLKKSINQIVDYLDYLKSKGDSNE